MKKENIFLKTKGALLPIALFLIVGIAALTPFLMQSAETNAKRVQYNGEWNKIQWAVSGLKNAHAVKADGSNSSGPSGPSGNSTVATFSYGDFHVGVSVDERQTMLEKNSCFSIMPTVWRGSTKPYVDAGFDLSDYTVAANSSPGVAAGNSSSFAWLKDGTLYAWGGNNSGMLGIGNSTNISTPTKVKQGDLPTRDGVSNFNQGWLVAASNNHSMAVDYSGNSYGWGMLNQTTSGLFNTTVTNEDSKLPSKLPFGQEALDITCGKDFYAVLGKDKKVYYRGWGDPPSLPKTKTISFDLINAFGDVKGISAGENHLLAITFNGDLWGYGSNSFYQLGRNDTTINSPVKINDSENAIISEVLIGTSNKFSPQSTQFTLSSAYNLASFTVTMNRKPKVRLENKWDWELFWIVPYKYTDIIFLDCDDNTKDGANDLTFPVGENDYVGKSKPYIWNYTKDTLIKPGTYTVKVMILEERKTSGDWQVVGKEPINSDWYQSNISSTDKQGVYSFYGSLADVPTGFIGVAAGGDFSMAIEEATGTTSLYTWGGNTFGQLGLGDNGSKSSMTKIPIPPSGKLRSIAAGKSHALALTVDGKVFAWGNNNKGQLGLGNTTNKNSPTAVTALNGKKIISIAAGDEHSLAMDDDFNVWAWGNNTSGRVGNGLTSGTQLSPVNITLP